MRFAEKYQRTESSYTTGALVKKVCAMKESQAECAICDINQVRCERF